jgi:hypothetical protein
VEMGVREGVYFMELKNMSFHPQLFLVNPFHPQLEANNEPHTHMYL